MPFAYLELTRRQLLDRQGADPNIKFDKKQRATIRSHDHNAMGDIKTALDTLGADNWELVSVVEAKDFGGEILYSFKKTI